MEDLLKILVGAFGSVITAGAGFIVWWFKYTQKRLDKLEGEKKEKDTRIQSLHNGFREEVNNRLISLEHDVILIKKTVVKEDK